MKKKNIPDLFIAVIVCFVVLIMIVLKTVEISNENSVRNSFPPAKDVKKIQMQIAKK